MTILYELNCFLFHITSHAWTGIRDLVMFETSKSGVAYSWPVGEVNIPPVDFWDRGTIIHELSHQVMWKEARHQYGDCRLGCGREAWAHHEIDLLHDSVHAMIEGWAEFPGGCVRFIWFLALAGNECPPIGQKPDSTRPASVESG